MHPYKSVLLGIIILTNAAMLIHQTANQWMVLSLVIGCIGLGLLVSVEK